MTAPSTIITGENEAKSPHLETGNNEIRERVTEVVNMPEMTALGKACTTASAFVLSYLARTPLGLAEEPKTIAEKALDLAKKAPGVGGTVEALETGQKVLNFMSGWLEKSFLTYPPPTALLAWASAMALVGTFLSKKQWKGWIASAIITKMAIGAIEQWGNEPLNWTTAGGMTIGAATIMTGMAIHRKDWLANFKKALGSGMGAAWEFLNRDIMPASANRGRGRSPGRAGRPEAEAVAPGPQEQAAAGADVFCTSCGSNQGGPSDFCTHCGVARTPAQAVGPAVGVVPVATTVQIPAPAPAATTTGAPTPTPPVRSLRRR